MTRKSKQEQTAADVQDLTANTTPSIDNTESGQAGNGTPGVVNGGGFSAPNQQAPEPLKQEAPADAEQPAEEVDPADGKVDTFEGHAQALNEPKWAVAAAIVLHGWAEGQEMTRADFKTAIKAVKNQVVS